MSQADEDESVKESPATPSGPGTRYDHQRAAGLLAARCELASAEAAGHVVIDDTIDLGASTRVEAAPCAPMPPGRNSLLDEIRGPIGAEHLPRAVDRLEDALRGMLEAMPEFDGGDEHVALLGSEMACLREAAREACHRADVPWASRFDQERNAEVERLLRLAPSLSSAAEEAEHRFSKVGRPAAEVPETLDGPRAGEAAASSLPLGNYRLGTRVRFDVGWPVPARSRWLDGIVTEVNDRLVVDNFAAVRTERELVVREVLDDGSIMTGGCRFSSRDAAALAVKAPESAPHRGGKERGSL